MTAIQAFRRGWSAASRSKWALLLMWFTYALIAKLVAVPAIAILLDPLTHSRVAGDLLSHFDVGWLGDLADAARSATVTLSAAGLVAAGLTWLVAVLFAGGIITMLDEHWERFSFTLFCSGAGEHFWRILRLSLLGLPCFALAWGLGRLPSMLAKQVYGEGMEGWPLGVASIIRSLLTVLLLGWVATALDYAKVRLVSGRKRGAFKALMYSFAFVARHLSAAMGVWLLNALTFALLGVIYLKLSGALQATTTATILLLVVLQQLFVLFRTAQRIAGWGSALEVHGAFAEPAQSLFEPEPVPCVVGEALPGVALEAERAPEPQEWDGYGI